MNALCWFLGFVIMGDNSLDYDTAKKYMDSARSGLRLARSYLSNLERVLGRSVKINSGVIYLLGEFHPDNLMWIGDLAYNLTLHTNLAPLLARQRMNIVVNSEQLGKDCYEVANQIIERQVEILGKLCPDVGYVEGTGGDHAFRTRISKPTRFSGWMRQERVRAASNCERMF